MKKTRYTEEQIAFALKQAETGTRVGEVCREAHRHEKDPLYRRTDRVCAETGRNRHPRRGSLPEDGHF
ncbi:transposase [Klebsiella aerogenes]|uniref:transposase n=1 Tax=Klebsiella aerogenes TaxID=548 RepID=UPI0009818D84